MSPELIGILAVGVALGGVFLTGAIWAVSWAKDSFDKIDARFEKVDARFEEVDARFERINDKFDKIDRRLDQIEQNQAVLLERTAPLAPAMKRK